MFTFVKNQEKCSLLEATEKIRNLQNIDIIIENTNDIKNNMIYNQQKRIELALKYATSYYSIKMVTDPSSVRAKNHLLSRRIKPETAFKFQIGYAPNPSFESRSPYSNSNSNNNNIINEKGEMRSLTANLTAEGFSLQELVIAGLTVDSSFYRNKENENDQYNKNENKNNIDNIENYNKNSKNSYKNDQYDRFRGRLMVPIKNENGVIIAFGGRILDDLNTNSVNTNSDSDDDNHYDMNNEIDSKERSSHDGGEASFQFSPENMAKLAAASSSSGRARYTGEIIYHHLSLS